MKKEQKRTGEAHVVDMHEHTTGFKRPGVCDERSPGPRLWYEGREVRRRSMRMVEGEEEDGEGGGEEEAVDVEMT